MPLPRFGRLPLGGACIFILLLVAGTGAFAQGLPEAAPEPATGRYDHSLVTAHAAMVVAANPLAAEAGRAILKAGGNAVDALVTVQMVLNLVEPQSSGIGGGAFIVLYNARSGQMTTIDGRETAPAGDRPDLFLDAAGKPLHFKQAQLGGHSVGVPGALAALDLAHRKYGHLPWNRLFEPAIHLANDGVPVSARLHDELDADKDFRAFQPAAKLFYGPGGAALPVGSKLVNSALAATLFRIAAQGPGVFYDGPIGHALVDSVRDSKVAPGSMTYADLAAYKAVERAPVCAPYRQWRICGMGPPSSGGVAVEETMGLLARTGFATQAPMSASSIHLVVEASRLAFADRDAYLADPDFVPVPVNGLLAADYLDARAKLIPVSDQGNATAGQPVFGWPWGPDASPGHPGTTQISIIDAAGNAASMTTTIESAFGSHLMSGGFLLNNQLTDFSFQPVADGRPVANRVEPGKRPRSTMAPTIVLDKSGRPVVVTGSPGGAEIAGFVVKALVAMLDWKMDPQQAADLPNFLNRNGPTEFEAGTSLATLIPDIAKLGHKVTQRDLTSGINSIEVTPKGLAGGTDPRREGEAAGY